MHKTLEALRDAWSPDDKEVRDESTARALAHKFVVDNPGVFNDDYDSKTLAQCVRAVDTFREAEMDEAQWRMEAWILHKFVPQDIGGEAKPQVRVYEEEKE